MTPKALLNHGTNLFWTIRYIAARQIKNRGVRMLKQKWRKVSKASAPMPTAFDRKPLFSTFAYLNDLTAEGKWEEEVHKALNTAQEMGRRQFTFLNQTVTSESHRMWNDLSLSQLWRYHLHYFSYTTELAIFNVLNKEKAGFRIFRELATSWIENNCRIQGDGWHPYTISLRIINWVEALSLFDADLRGNSDFEKMLTSSVYGQAQFLFNNLEFDVRGNHLLKNLRGLIWCSHAFKGQEPEQWFEKAIAVLQKELEEQVLSDGGHFERNPGYHAAVLKDCLEIGQFLRLNGDGTTYKWLENAIDQMYQYLIAILPPEGNLPLLKDTAWDAAPRPNDLMAAGAIYTNRPEYRRSDEFGLYPLLLFGKSGYEKFIHWPLQNETSTAATPRYANSKLSRITLETPNPRKCEALVLNLPDSGFIVLRSDNPKTYMIVDVGRVCPDNLPAHAHADLFSFELHVEGKRVVVDSGVFEYTKGKWRDFFRSTRAHNTVEISATNQSEVWSSFRVAKRAKAFDVSIRKGVSHFIIEGKHDGYCRLKPPVIPRRMIVWEIGKFWLIVDEIDGKGITEANSFVHLSPEIWLEKEDASSLKIKGLPRPLWIRVFGTESHYVVKGQKDPIPQGWYSEKFGVKLPNPVITIRKKACLPFLFGYIISFDSDIDVENHLNCSENRRIIIQDSSNNFTFQIDSQKISYC